MNTLEMKNEKHNRADFARLRSVLACASKDASRYVITKVLVEKDDVGITIVATDGRRMRSDRFSLEAEPGLYDIKVCNAKTVFLSECSEDLALRAGTINETHRAHRPVTATGKLTAR